MDSGAREITVSEALYKLLKITYAVVGVPFLLIAGIATLSALNSGTSPGSVSGIPLMSLLIWATLILPLVFFFRGRKARKKKLKKIIESLKEASFFQPAQGNETRSTSMDKYFGIDVKNGTILYVHRIRKGQVDVVGMTMSDWTHREISDKTLRLYTKFVDLPCIEIASYDAQRWYDMLGAMEHKRYSTPKPFPEYVRDHVAQLERDHQIHIPQVA